ncbi:hypothetical protein [Pontibacter chitinilyticus]|uniref:hypothetical protein n=1 Tax=Pontibacter chitinilyticus TaxID=2674989 RepID=UPI00321AF3EB
MVEIFKTNITDKSTADNLLAQLQQKLPAAKITFDLDDCDHILKVVHYAEIIAPVTELLHQQGFECEVLE